MRAVTEDLINEFGINLAYHFSEVLNTPLAKPYWVFISLSHKCNLDCRMCGVKHVLKGQELEFDLVKKALNEVAGWDSDCVVLFTGGEPFLRRDIFDIIGYSVSLGLKTEVVSNGSLINNPEIAKNIIESGLKNIAISLDGAHVDTHDYIRASAGAHKKATDALRYLSQAKRIKGPGPQISAWVTIMNQNVLELYQIISLADSLGVECLVYHPVIAVQDDMQNTVSQSRLWIDESNAGIFKEQIDKIMDYQKKNGLVAFLHNPYLWLDYFQGKISRKDWKCNPFVFIDIGPDGEVRSCGAPFGNIKDMSLEACLNTQEAHNARERMLRCRKPCLQTCWGRPEADSLTGIVNGFIGEINKLEAEKGQKNKLLSEAFEILSGYERMTIRKHNKTHEKQAQ